ncbi:MAG: hypothetical protein ChlgKO_10210 [Chlamydiales bacterium]
MSAISSCFGAIFTVFGWESSVTRDEALVFIKQQMISEDFSSLKSQPIAPFAHLYFDRLIGEERVAIWGTENDQAIFFCAGRGCEVYVVADQAEIQSFKNALSDAFYYLKDGCYQSSNGRGKIFLSSLDGEFDLIYAHGRISQNNPEMIESSIGMLKSGEKLIGDIPLHSKEGHWYLPNRAYVHGLFQGVGEVAYCDYDHFCCSGNVNFIIQAPHHRKAH